MIAVGNNDSTTGNGAIGVVDQTAGSLTLGSAYFRVDRLPDAEREFRAALAVEPKFGEALSNLALVCLLTGRAQEAQSYVRVAEEAKFTVNPELKRRIREALQKG